MKPWPDWVLWLMFVLCLVASIGITGQCYEQT